MATCSSSKVLTVNNIYTQQSPAKEIISNRKSQPIDGRSANNGAQQSTRATQNILVPISATKVK